MICAGDGREVGRVGGGDWRYRLRRSARRVRRHRARRHVGEGEGGAEVGAAGETGRGEAVRQGGARWVRSGLQNLP